MTLSKLTRRLALAGAVTLLALPAGAQAISGQYAVQGRNPDGSGYSGTVIIRTEGEFVAMSWAIGNSNYAGTGRIEGRVLTVDWGAETPVVYVLMPNGALHGTWADGLALERLTP